MLNLLLFILPLGLDTLGVSISLGIKSNRPISFKEDKKTIEFPSWLHSALLFSFAETTMPLIGLVIGLAASLIISNVMRYVGPLILIGVGAWELWEEFGDRLVKSSTRNTGSHHDETIITGEINQEEKVTQRSNWQRQLLLALSISLDELAVGFSLGTATVAKSINPITLCVLIGLQGFLMTLIGIALGRTLRTRMKPLIDWSEILSGLLLIGLGVWLLLT